MSRINLAGLISAASGGLLVVALLLDWWDYPSAFEDPAALPEPARLLAEGIAMSGRSADADAFEFFEFRDIVWLAAGVLTFGFGLLVLTTRRVIGLLGLGVGALALAAVVLIALTLISPPDYADLAPDAARPVDLGVDLPLDPGLGGFVALAAALGSVAGAVLALAHVSRAD